MNILFIAPYPDEYNPHHNVFVFNLVQKITQLGANAEVISPIFFWKKRKEKISTPGEKSYGEENVRVLRPRMLYLPNSIKFGDYSLGKYNSISYSNAVKSVLTDLKFKPDIVYAHFLFFAGPGALAAAEHFKIPAVVALGESTLDRHKKVYSENDMRSIISDFPGIISVSEVNKEYCINKLNVNEHSVEVIPNAVNEDLFYPRDKELLREKYNFPKDKFIVAFTGNFINRKGSLRVLEAINQLPEDVNAIFIGDGPQKPSGKKVLFSDSVPHNLVPELLCSADLFVLPTLKEGSCNAIAEAMACGLPIVSSDIPSVREQVPPDNSILCDPLDTQQLSMAIEKIFLDKTLCNNMKMASIEVAKGNSLSSRAEKIMSFLKKQIH